MTRVLVVWAFWALLVPLAVVLTLTSVVAVLVMVIGGDR